MARSALPRVLVLSWHADPCSMTEQILSKVISLPAELVPVPGGRVSGIMDELESRETVALHSLPFTCCPEEDESLYQFVQTCGDLILHKPEFRLFVQLADGLVFDNSRQGQRIRRTEIEMLHMC